MSSDKSTASIASFPEGFKEVCKAILPSIWRGTPVRCVCVRACVHVCVRACVHVAVFVCVSVCV